jgi:hypothetical protein
LRSLFNSCKRFGCCRWQLYAPDVLLGFQIPDANMTVLSHPRLAHPDDEALSSFAIVLHVYQLAWSFDAKDTVDPCAEAAHVASIGSLHKWIPRAVQAGHFDQETDLAPRFPSADGEVSAERRFWRFSRNCSVLAVHDASDQGNQTNLERLIVLPFVFVGWSALLDVQHLKPDMLAEQVAGGQEPRR